MSIFVMCSLLVVFYPSMIVHSFSLDSSKLTLQEDQNIQDDKNLQVDESIHGEECVQQGYRNLRGEQSVGVSSEGENGVSQPDVKFRTIQDDSDVWYWNSKIIRRYQKSTDTWTYYWTSVTYAQLEARWDKKSRAVFYFLDGNQITTQQAQSYAQTRFGLSVGSKIPVGNPQFSLHINSSSPVIKKNGQKRSLKKGTERLKDRYQQKYQPEFWMFTALAVTDNSIWVAVRSIPLRPESIQRFVLPDGSVAPRHFRESQGIPMQGGVVKIDKESGEYIRFIEKNGLPKKLVCTPLSDESWGLPHFLPPGRFPQEVVDIKILENGRIRFTTRSNQQVFYDSEQEKWEDAQ